MTERLYGKKILVTRPEHRGGSLCRMIEAEGGKAISLPMLEIKPVEVDADLKRRLSEIAVYDAAIFVSQNAVDAMLKLLQGDLGGFTGKPVFAIGKATARALTSAGLEQAIYPETGADSESLLSMPALQASKIRSKKIIIFRGRGGRSLLAESLRHRGAHVDYAEVYRRVPAVYDQATLDKLWLEQKPDLLVSSSGEGLQNLFDMLISRWRRELLTTPLVVLGKRMAEQAKHLGFTGRIDVVEEVGDEGLMTAIRRSAEAEKK